MTLTYSVPEDQVQQEVKACIEMVYDTYTTFGFENIVVKLSASSEQRVKFWQKCGTVLRLTLSLH